MDNLFFVLVEGVSAAIAFVLVWFMVKPYRMTGENRFLGLPIGFAFLGVSYIFMGASLSLGESSLLDDVRWLQLFTGAYAFVFIAVTYHLSFETREQKARLLMQAFASLTVLVSIFLFVVVFLPPVLAFPSYKAADEYFRVFNMMLALYVTLQTLRSHALNPESKTILAPLGYALLAFSQYSFLIWSLDSSFSAFIGAHAIRIVGLLVFLFVSYEAIIARKNVAREGQV
jgi:hypothetical protein